MREEFKFLPDNKDLEGRVIILADATSNLDEVFALALARSSACVVLGTDDCGVDIPLISLPDFRMSYKNLDIETALSPYALAVEYFKNTVEGVNLLLHLTKTHFGGFDTLIYELRVPQIPPTRESQGKRSYLYDNTLLPVEIVFALSSEFMKSNDIKGTNILVTPQIDPRVTTWEERIIRPTALEIFSGLKEVYSKAGIQFIHHEDKYKLIEQIRPYDAENYLNHRIETLKNLVKH